MPSRRRSNARNIAEFLPAWVLLNFLRLLPRRAALAVARGIARAFYVLHGRLRKTAYRNLSLAMPELSSGEHRRIVKGVFDNLGRLLGEFAQMPKLSRSNIGQVVEYEGFENYIRAAEKGKGILWLTGHVGAWELCAFAHGAHGHPLSFLVRPLDNPLLDRLVERYRTVSGNRTIRKSNPTRAVLSALGKNEAVGLLVDVNTLQDQGVFCDFFGIPACTPTGLALFALRSDAPVLPGFLVWDVKRGKHVLRIGPEVPLIRTGDFREELRLNTGRFNKVIEEQVRRYPDHWLWVHRRWHTRPPGEVDLYGASTRLPPSRCIDAGVEAHRAGQMIDQADCME